MDTTITCTAIMHVYLPAPLLLYLFLLLLLYPCLGRIFPQIVGGRKRVGRERESDEFTRANRKERT